MLHTLRCRRGLASTPHHLASQSALAVLREGGTAIEAAVAAAATIAVVYPHMNSIGGDGFWLIRLPGRDPIGIDACGRAGHVVSPQRYHEAGFSAIPQRGPWAANTVAGTVSGWEQALQLSASINTPLPLSRLLRDAIDYATEGVPLTHGCSELLALKQTELASQPGFAAVFLDREGKSLPVGHTLRQPQLAQTLRTLANAGLASFYHGEVADALSQDLAACGALIDRQDLAAHAAQIVSPLVTEISAGRLYNLPPPTQGVASLMILALFERLGVREAESFAHLHGLIECTKRAFAFRDAEVGDPRFMRVDAQQALDDAGQLDTWADAVDRTRATPWPWPAQPGDTVWLGCTDSSGCTVSLIQSTYFEFGSGVVLPATGVTWQNRGCSFRLAEEGCNALQPGRQPFHTLNPAMAQLRDGRWMGYGTMGGEGQPQTQAAIFTRYALFGQELQQAVSAPRWLLGRTWGEASSNLKIEGDFDAGLIDELRAAGHELQVIEPFSHLMGHAGAVVQCADGTLEGASDPRSDGSVAGF
ncbi:MAG: gamma-glutamyltransferase [Steroidobacteraceae bacterium]